MVQLGLETWDLPWISSYHFSGSLFWCQWPAWLELSKNCFYSQHKDLFLHLFFHSDTKECLKHWAKQWALLWSVTSSLEIHRKSIPKEKTHCPKFTQHSTPETGLSNYFFDNFPEFLVNFPSILGVWYLILGVTEFFFMLHSDCLRSGSETAASDEYKSNAP